MNPDSKSDAELVSSFRIGDVDAFGTLFSRYLKFAVTCALSILHNQADAEECVQDAFLSAFEALSGYDERFTFQAWLKRIVVHKCIDRLRKKKRIQRPDNFDEVTADSDPAFRIAFGEKRDAIMTVLATLSEIEQAYVRLRFYETLSPDEIGRDLNIPLSNVYWLGARIKK